MNELLEKYNDYMKIKNHRAEYALENGAIISFVYKEENFIHLLGLHKLKDIKIIQKFNDKSNLKVNAKYILRRIKKEIITDSVIKSSLFFNDISERYDNFTYEKLSTLVYTDVIINFNPSLVKLLNSSAISGYISSNASYRFIITTILGITFPLFLTYDS